MLMDPSVLFFIAFVGFYSIDSQHIACKLCMKIVPLSVISFCNGFQVRVNTRLLYQQTKFNLLREESEGYAKLVTVSSVFLSLSLCPSFFLVSVHLLCLLVTALDALSLFLWVILQQSNLILHMKEAIRKKELSFSLLAGNSSLNNTNFQFITSIPLWEVSKSQFISEHG